MYVPYNPIIAGLTDRRPQRECISALIETMNNGGKDFLAEICVGGGKTNTALGFSKWIREEKGDHKLIIVVPSDEIRKGWVDDAKNKFGLNLSSNYDSRALGSLFNDGWGDRLDGIVISYQSLARSYASGLGIVEQIVRRLEGRSIVVMDEVHHGGDGLPWGDAAVAAFADAGFRLGLTGTPYRHDKAPIPWVKYIKVSELDDGPGIVVPQYHYRYGDGLADKIVSPIDFTWIGGHVERSPDDGEEFTDGLPDVFDFDDDYSDITDKGVRLRMMNKRLAIALSSHNRALVEGEKSLVREVVNALSQRREVYEKSAAAIICDSFEQLIVIKRALESYGLDVRYTTYREASSDNVVKEFNEGQGDVLLSIKQLAEGVSIPRLQTLGLAMCITTQLFFTQVVGRLARMITGIPFYLQHGSVICMKDPRFVEYAEAFKNPDLDVLQRPVVRTEKVCPECHELVPISAKVCPHCGYIFGGGDPLPEKEELHDGETKAGGMTVDGKTFTAEEVAEIVEQIQASPLISSDPLFRSLPIETQIRAFNAAMNAYRN